MSTALSHIFGTPVSQLSGAACQYNFADLLEECFGPSINSGRSPAVALNEDGLEELFEAVEGILREAGQDEDDADVRSL